jgi:hypothetical protein
LAEDIHHSQEVVKNSDFNRVLDNIAAAFLKKMFGTRMKLELSFPSS